MRAADVVWGETLCSTKCARIAICIWLDEDRELCAECADLEIERLAAIESDPRLREMLPPLYER